MDEARSLPNVSAKEMLLKQIRRCRDRLQIMLTLRDNVLNAIDEACMAVTSIVTAVEQAAETAGAAELKLLSKDLRHASNTMRRYENTLESVLDVSEDEADGGITVLNPFERGSTGSLNRGPSSTNDLRQLGSHLAELPSASGLAVPEAELIAGLPSPDFLTAESCFASSFTDATSVDRLRVDSPILPSAPRSPEPEQNFMPTVPMSTIAPGQLAAGAVAVRVALPPPVNTADLIQINREYSMEATGNQATASLTLSTSTTGNLTTSDSISSNGDVFVEGDSVPCGKFLVGNDNLVRFYMRHVVSTDEFYVRPVSHEASAVFAQLQDDLSIFYDDDENRKQLFQDIDCNSAVNVGRYGIHCRRYAHTYNTDMERVVVIGWRESMGANHYRGIQRYEAHIRFIDTGGKMWVPADQIWKIERRFCKVPALSICCRLFDTRPRNEGIATAFGIWPEDATAKFKSLCDGDRPMSGLVARSEEPVALMVYVFHGEERICINAEMVLSKHAKTLTNWNRITSIISVAPQNRIPTQHEAALNLNVDFLCFGPEIPILTPPSVGDVVEVEVQRWFNCCRFVVNFPQGIGDVSRMDRDPQYKRERYEPVQNFLDALPRMSEACSQDESLAFGHWPMVGQLVAAKFQGRYYRARLLDVAPQDNSAHVRYVDYGNDQWVPIDTLRILEPEYLGLPYMAMECRLASIRPMRPLSTNDLNMLQEQIRTLPSGKDLLAEVVHVLERERPAGPVLSVNLRSKDGAFFFNQYMVQNGWATWEIM